MGALLNILKPICIYLALLAFFRLHAYHGVNIWDEGAHPHAAIRILNGDIPYADFFSNPPGPAYIFGFFFLFFPASLALTRTLWLLATPLIPMLFFYSARKIMPVRYALFGAGALILAPGPAFNREIALVIVANFLVLFRYIEQPSLKRAFTLGLVNGLSVMFRLDMCGFAVITTTLFITMETVTPLWRKVHPQHQELLTNLSLFKRNGMVVAGWGIGGSYYLYQYATHYKFRYHLIEFFHQLAHGAHAEQGLPFPRLLDGERWQSALRGIVHFDGSALHPVLDLVLYHLPLWVYLAVALTLAWRLYQGRFQRMEALAAFGFIFSLLNFNEAYWRCGIGNYMRVFSATLMIILWAVSQLAALPVVNNSLWRKRFTQGAFIALGLFLCWHLTFHPAGYEIGSPSVLAKEMTYLNHPRVRLYVAKNDYKLLQWVQRKADTYTSINEPIWVVPLAPVFYFITARPNPTYYEWMMPWWWKGTFQPKDHLEFQIMNELGYPPVPLIFHSDVSLTTRPNSRWGDYTPKVYEWMKQKYRKDPERSGFYEVYTRVGLSHEFSLTHPSQYSLVLNRDGNSTKKVLPSIEGDFNFILMNVPSIAVWSGDVSSCDVFKTTCHPFVHPEFEGQAEVRIRILKEILGSRHKTVAFRQTMTLHRETSDFYPVVIPIDSVEKIRLIFEVATKSGPNTGGLAIGWKEPTFYRRWALAQSGTAGW